MDTSSDFKYIHRDAQRVDSLGVTKWFCRDCVTSSTCCIYNTQKCFKKDQYIQRCVNYIGVDEYGLICKIPNSLHFIFSEE